MLRLPKLHKSMGQLAHDTPDILELPEVTRALETELTYILVRCFADGHSLEPTTGRRRSRPPPIEVNLPRLALSALCGIGRPFLNYYVWI